MKNKKEIPKSDVFYAAAEINTKFPKYFRNISMTKIDQLVESKYPDRNFITHEEFFELMNSV